MENDDEQSRNPLRKMTLKGQADAIEAQTAAITPFLGDFVMRGQATMIYAPPNSGKTLLMTALCLEAITEGRCDPDNLYYVNADDSAAGMVTKLRLLQDAGAHMLVPGFRAFKTSRLADLLHQAAENGSARNTFVFIDTLKKFTDLMDKRRSSEFAQVCREYVMAGGTIIALGHTTKTPHANGTPRYQGTTDVLEDFDAVYVGEVMVPVRGAGDRVFKLSALKRRADSPEEIAYAYSAASGQSYESKVASVRRVDIDDLEDYTPEQGFDSDPVAMDTIVGLLREGFEGGKMQLAKEAARRLRISHRTAVQVVERYTGTNPRQHLWDYQTGAHGKRHYTLLPPPVSSGHSSAESQNFSMAEVPDPDQPET